MLTGAQRRVMKVGAVVSPPEDGSFYTPAGRGVVVEVAEVEGSILVQNARGSAKWWAVWTDGSVRADLEPLGTCAQCGGPTENEGYCPKCDIRW